MTRSSEKLAGDWEARIAAAAPRSIGIGSHGEPLCWAFLR